MVAHSLPREIITDFQGVLDVGLYERQMKAFAHARIVHLGVSS